MIIICNMSLITFLVKGSWRRQWHPTPVLLPGESDGWRSLVGCSPWGREELDTTERLHFHFSLSCIGEGKGNPPSVLAWRIPGKGQPGGLPSMGSHRVGHDWSDLAATAAAVKGSRICQNILFGIRIILSWLFSRNCRHRKSWELSRSYPFVRDILKKNLHS